jgi:AraC-like DNA-binding protein
MDPLTQLVELLRPRALLWKRLTARGDWAWRFPTDAGVVFGLVISGRCRFQLPGAEEQELGPGDYLLMAAPPVWILRGGGDAPIEEFEALYPDLAAEEANSDPDTVKIVGGHFEFDSANVELLGGFLSPIVHVRAAKNGGGRLGGILAMMDEEASTNLPGQASMLSRLLEIVLLELLRTPMALPDERQRGMMAGLAHPRIAAALRAFHADIRRGWSVSSLARVAGMSRSAFSQRFTEVVGEPPMTYVLKWRIAFARDALKFSDRSLDEIAHESGYGSASAFSTAFSRLVGRSPASFAREARDSHERSARYRRTDGKS